MSSVILAASASARYALGAIMYFAQGIPQGLLNIALPAWLASKGASAGQVGSYLAVVSLPWAFKLVTGPLMDRFEFPSMGRRRPWVIGAQAGLAGALLGLSAVNDPVAQIGLLSLIGFAINCFAATQDVAVDGLSIDVTPLREQGKLNGFMSFGKAIGWSSTAAVAGILLIEWGLSTTATLAAVVSVLPLLVILAVREREGERVWPWSKGEAAAVSRDEPSFRSVVTAVNKVLWSRTSLLVMAIMFFDGLIYGYGQALMPFAAVNLFGYTSAQWSQLVAMMGLVGAVAALLLGPLIDRIGARGMLTLTCALVGLHAFTLSQTQFLWENTLYVRAMLSAYVTLNPVIMVASLALAMAICSSNVSATQFAIYMSMANLGHTFGSKLYGTVADQAGYTESWLMMSALVIAMVAVLLMYRQRPDAGEDSGGGVSHVAAVVPGAGAATFWSGAIRCPKCRTDMEQVEQGDVVLDRCIRCHGLWFDAGEFAALDMVSAARDIDVGDTELAREQDKLHDYDCPRCGGVMVHTQEGATTVGYETCSSCQGSFLDAGELRALALATPTE